MMSSFKLARSIILKRSFIQYRRVFNTNDCSNFFTRSLVQFRPVVSSRFLNTSGDDHQKDRLDSTFEDAAGHDVFNRFVKSKIKSWYAKRRFLECGKRTSRISDIKADIKRNSDLLQLSIPKLKQEEIKVLDVKVFYKFTGFKPTLTPTQTR
nr:hypothetical protein [Tanacetum cinerariifolium]